MGSGRIAVHLDADSVAHDPRIVRSPRESDRRWRGRRAPRLGAQGTAGEQSRCRRGTDRGGARRRRIAPAARRGRRRRHGARRSPPCACPTRDEQDLGPGRPRTRSELRLSRRGAREHRVGVAATHREPTRGRPPRVADRSHGRARRRPGAGGGRHGHDGRDARPLLQHARAAQVSAHRRNRVRALRGGLPPGSPRATRRRAFATAQCPRELVAPGAGGGDTRARRAGR